MKQNTLQPYTSGMVVGMTHIPAATIRRYVRDFKPYLSEEATKPHRGRRYTPQDIQTLLTIRHLYQERKSKAEIESALKGEWTPPALPRYDIEDATAIVAEARQYFLEARQNSRNAQSLVHKAKASTSYLYKRFDEVVEQLNNHVTSLRSEVAMLQSEVKELKEAQQTQKRGLFG
jgi:DNA-binding transcriptional MerR regulator